MVATGSSVAEIGILVPTDRGLLEADATHEVLEVRVAVEVVPLRIDLQQIHLVVALPRSHARATPSVSSCSPSAL